MYSYIYVYIYIYTIGSWLVVAGQQAPGVLVGASHLQLDQIVMAQHSSEALAQKYI